ncbi:MAG: AAA family ATPase [Fluviicola sp.]|nr:AAA family ATPase [Fluviicola sp.]
MIGREEQTQLMVDALKAKHSSFVAITGRRRVGKTYIVREVYTKNMCFSVTGIQSANLQTQLNNFVQKLQEHNPNTTITGKVTDWQQAFALLKFYLKSLPKTKKQVVFIDELPWIATAKSKFTQLLAHLWNDYLSVEKHFILVVCGSATSWITQKIINDKGGFHNRVNLPIHLKPFTLAETKQFLATKNINYTPTGIAEIYMALGGLPYYLEQLKKGESPAKAIERICFEANGILKNEYNNLYKALFNYWENHEAIVSVLAKSHNGLTREQLINASKVSAGGPFTRTMNDLLLTGFVEDIFPFGKKKRGSVYRLVDEFSVFYHRFMKGNEKKDAAIWQQIAQSQSYKTWKGFAFESLCLKHIQEIKKALGILGVYTETSSFTKVGNTTTQGFQIDLVIDRKDAAINLCECKFYESDFEISKKYAQEIKQRKVAFQQETKTKKMLINTFISNEEIIENEHAHEVVDAFIHLSELM